MFNTPEIPLKTRSKMQMQHTSGTGTEATHYSRYFFCKLVKEKFVTDWTSFRRTCSAGWIRWLGRAFGRFRASHVFVFRRLGTVEPSFRLRCRPVMQVSNTALFQNLFQPFVFDVRTFVQKMLVLSVEILGKPLPKLHDQCHIRSWCLSSALNIAISKDDAVQMGNYIQDFWKPEKSHENLNR